MTELPHHQTKTELALQRLRDRIRTGDLQPGERLRLDVIKEELGMSATPIREALRLLQADGLVDYRPHQGIVVAEHSGERIAEIHLLRSVLEPLAIERTVPMLTGETLARLDQLHDALRDAVESGHGSDISSRNAEWHWAIYELSDLPHLKEFIRRLWELFPWRTMWVLPERAERSVEEHAQIMEAIRAGDAELASRRLRAHILSGEQSLLDQAAAQAEC